MTVWTHFFDMSSGGGSKEDYDHIFIQAPEGEAVVLFYNRFGHNPQRVSCTCCGEDYSIDELDPEVTPEDVMSIDVFQHDQALTIPASEIQPEECKGDVPQQGYVWF